MEKVLDMIRWILINLQTSHENIYRIKVVC